MSANFSSTLQVLKLNEIERGISSKSGKPWERHTAECILLGDDGSIECVGKLNIPEPLRGIVQTGTFRAGFTLHVPTFGDQQGQITSRLVSLTPVPVKGAAPVQAPAKAA